MSEFILILLALGGLSLFFIKTGQNAEFDLSENAVVFYKQKQTIKYSDVLSIEKDLTGSLIKLMNSPSYVITYYDDTGKVNSFRFNKTSADLVNRETLKRKIIDQNPSAKIDESKFKI